MIPARLQVRNFMCYRENVPPLEFGGIHLAVLSGNNGNGKSALIDAITWALWGRTRSDSIDNLIHALANEMEVQFDFRITDTLYRVIRKRSKPKKRTGAGQSALEFQVKSGDAFRSISGNTIGETQQKIIDTLHMDYDTFVNSAYLRQGHADEFTRQPPGKRKEVLGTILGLDTYDDLEEKARALARQKENERAQAEAAINDVVQELAQRTELQSAYEQAQALLTEAEKIAQEKEAAVSRLRSRLETLQAQQAQLDAIDQQMEKSRRLAESLQQQAADHRKRAAGYRAIIERKAEVETGYTDYKAARKASDDFSTRLQKSVALERKRTELEKAIDKARQEIARMLDRYQQEVEKLEERVQTLPGLRKQLSTAETELQGFSDKETALQEQEKQAQESKQQLSLLEAEATRLHQEIAEAGEKLDLLARHHEEHADARCPLCESELTREGLDLIESKYRKEQEAKTTRLAAVLAETDNQRAGLARRQAELEKSRKTLKEQQTTRHGQASVLRKDIEEREADEKRLIKGKGYVAATGKLLENRDYAADEQRQLATLDSEVKALGYDEEQHRTVQARAERLQNWEQEHQKLEEAERLVGQEESAAQKAENSTTELEASLKQDSERRDKLAVELENLPEIQQQAATAETEYRELSAGRSRAQETVGAVRARLEHLDGLEKKKKDREKELAETAREAAAYKDLAKAFGKSGIQALLIDMALPDIENEANRLLTKMTDNRMHVNFETQQETKSGTVKETLDIFITDELGTRDYEMFSGGEAFRINFAIRIALSRLLAKRAGAPLPTLIIDEGFGTQDSSGMEKLKEAINSIQDDFEKILVVTHMDELKDAFPCRIDVVKTPEGSSITVN